MSYSPALRSSPRREFRVQNHKRGRSLEGGLLRTEKDDQLALFTEMQTRESHNLLLYSIDDLDDSSRKLKHFSDLKLGISIPVRGESRDLLCADGEKNEYNWLLTPPDTPLFRSLDDEIPSANHSHGSRPQIQPISIKRSLISYKASRSNASPHQLSPSSRSGNTILQPRKKSSSAPHSSTSPNLRSTVPSQIPSTPQNKTSGSAHRSPTPTSWQVSTRSSGTGDSPGRRGQSPVKMTTSATSASSKAKAWQSNVPGFFMDSPPNLRTSLSDRPASYVRGSSPASWRERGSSSKSGRRRSMSPTASRSSSSAYHIDHDQLNSRPCSIASSADDLETLLSATTSVSTLSASREVGRLSNKRTNEFLKKPLRTISSDSASRRSPDSALGPMDRKIPQNMFRPLLSSAPTGSFYVMTANSARCSVLSCSVTTSSNASSEQGGSVAFEGSNHDRDGMKIGRGKTPYPDAQDEIFIFDEVEKITKEVGQKIRDGKPNVMHNGFAMGTNEVEQGDCKKIINHDVTTEAVPVFPKPLSVEGGLSAVNCYRNISACPKCAREFHIIEPLEGNDMICQDCRKMHEEVSVITAKAAVTVAENARGHSQMRNGENGFYNGVEYKVCIPELQDKTSGRIVSLVQRDLKIEQRKNCLLDVSLSASMGEGGQCLADRQELGQPTSSCAEGDGEIMEQEMKKGYSSVKLDLLEDAGISVILKRLSTSKCSFVEAGPFIAADVHCDDPSFAGKNLNTLGCSFGHCKSSASSSVDLGTSGETESHLQWQLNGMKTDRVEHSGSDLNAKPQSCGSIFSETSNQGYRDLVFAKSLITVGCDGSDGIMKYNDKEEIPIFKEKQDSAPAITEKCDRGSSIVRPDFLVGNELDHAENSKIMNTSAVELCSCAPNTQLHCSVAELPNNKECVSSWSLKDLSNNMGGETTVAEVQIYGSPAESLGKLQNGHIGDPSKQFNFVDFPNSESARDESQLSVHSTPEKDTSVPFPESSISYHAYGILEELTVTIEGPGHKRSLTLGEATETTLFCRSIVHDLAYLAATIGADRQNSATCLEGSYPTDTITGQNNSDRKNHHRGVGGKISPKTPKTRHRRVNTDMEIPSAKTETDLVAHESFDSEVPSKIGSMKPPKLESKCNCTVL